MTLTASVGQAADLKIENGPRFSITCTGVLETRNGIYFFSREKPITGLTPDDEIACWGASILANDKGCWPMRGKSIEQILAVCPIGKDVSDRRRIEKSNSRSLLLDRGELSHCEMMRVSCHTFVWPLTGNRLFHMKTDQNAAASALALIDAGTI